MWRCELNQILECPSQIISFHFHSWTGQAKPAPLTIIQENAIIIVFDTPECQLIDCGLSCHFNINFNPYPVYWIIFQTCIIFMHIIWIGGCKLIWSDLTIFAIEWNDGHYRHCYKIRLLYSTLLWTEETETSRLSVSEAGSVAGCLIEFGGGFPLSHVFNCYNILGVLERVWYNLLNST